MTGPTAYGVYLIPPPELAYPVGLGHLLLKSNFGLQAGGAFMPHSTLFAFIHLQDGLGAEDIINVLDRVLPQHRAFPLQYKLETEWFIRLDLVKYPALLNLQARIRQELWPLLSDFGKERRADATFNPHITLAFRDLPTDPGLLAQIHAYCRRLAHTFPANGLKGQAIQLVEFTVPDPALWSTPDYYKTFSWRIIKGYNLT